MHTCTICATLMFADQSLYLKVKDSHIKKLGGCDGFTKEQQITAVPWLDPRLYATTLCTAHMPRLTGQKTTIHQVTTLLASSKNVPFPGHNHHANHGY